MKPNSLYRSLFSGMLVMMAAFVVCLVANLLCIFSLISLPVCLLLHTVLLPACVLVFIFSLIQLRKARTDEPIGEADMVRGATRLLLLGCALLLILVVWASFFAMAIFSRGAL